LLSGAPLTRGLVEYGTRWRATPFVYALLEAPLRPIFDARAARDAYAHVHIHARGLLIEERGAPIVSLGDAHIVARPILVDAGFCARLLAGALLALVVVVVARRIRDPALRVGAALAALWMLAPTVHPWYFVWLVPFAALSSSRALWLLSASSPLLYQPVFGYAANGVWHEAMWPRFGVLAALVVGLVLDAKTRRSGSSVASGSGAEE